MNKRYIAIIGKTAAGKAEFGLMLQEELGRGVEVSYHRFSDPLNGALDELALEKSRPNQQWLSRVVRKKHGEKTLGNALLKRAEADSAGIIYFDGVRRPQDVATVRKLNKSILIEITAPPKKRWERLRERSDRPGDANKSWKQFCKEQNAEPERLIDTIAKKADSHIDNSGTKAKLREHVRAFIKKFGISPKKPV